MGLFSGMETLTSIALWPLQPFISKADNKLPVYLGVAAGIAGAYYFVGNPLNVVGRQEPMEMATWYVTGAVGYAAVSTVAQKLDDGRK